MLSTSTHHSDSTVYRCVLTRHSRAPVIRTVLCIAADAAYGRRTAEHPSFGQYCVLLHTDAARQSTRHSDSTVYRCVLTRHSRAPAIRTVLCIAAYGRRTAEYPPFGQYCVSLRIDAAQQSTRHSDSTVYRCVLTRHSRAPAIRTVLCIAAY